MTAARVTDRDMLNMLRRHYLPEGRPTAGVFAPEMSSPDGKRRADLIWMPVTAAAHGQGIVGHEIKVSRADLINELADRLKADSWIQYCSHWYLVIPDPAMADGLVIPDAWGIMTPPSGRRTRSMTITRKAPRLETNDLKPAYLRIARWLHWRTDEIVRDNASWKQRHEEQRRRIEQLEQQIRELNVKLREAGLAHTIAPDPRQRIVEDILAGLQQATSAYPTPASIAGYQHQVDTSDVVQALVDLGALRHEVARGENTLTSIRSQAKRLAEMAARVAEGTSR